MAIIEVKKLAKSNSATKESWESDLHFSQRVVYGVEDTYDFVGNNATEVTDAHTIQALMDAGRDYIILFTVLENYVVSSGGIGLLPPDEQPIALYHLTVPPEVVERIKEQRRSRIDECTAKVYVELSRTEVSDVMEDLSGDSLMEKYVQESRLGTIENSGYEGIIDYLLSRIGTSYELTGLTTKGFIPNTMSITDLADELSNKLKYGEL